MRYNWNLRSILNPLAEAFSDSGDVVLSPLKHAVSTLRWLETLPEPEGGVIVPFPENTGELLHRRDLLNAGPSWCGYGWRTDYSMVGDRVVAPGSMFPSLSVCSLRLLMACWRQRA
jgi:hypothetical protein